MDGQLIFNKGAKTVQWEKNSFAKNSDRTTGYPFAKEWP